MKLDANAEQLITTRRAEGKSIGTITKELRGQGYAQAKGGNLQPHDVYNFIAAQKATGTGTTVKAPVKTTTTPPLVPVSFVTSVLDAKWNANKKVSVLKAAYQNY
jgi:hypothetical protein